MGVNQTKSISDEDIRRQVKRKASTDETLGEKAEKEFDTLADDV